MNYTSAVSIIPGGCPQFLDCRLDLQSLGKFSAIPGRCRATTPPRSPLPAGPRNSSRSCPTTRGASGTMIMPSPPSARWKPSPGAGFPCPSFRLSSEQWKDGGLKCERGPSNWARLHVGRDEDGGPYALTFPSTATEEREEEAGSTSQQYVDMSCLRSVTYCS
ncbi:MAG: hypothetical protein V8Q84_06260, partial [Bilophila sp.]